MKTRSNAILTLIVIGSLFGGSLTASAKTATVAPRAQVQTSQKMCPPGQTRINSISWAGQFNGVPEPEELKEAAKTGCMDPRLVIHIGPTSTPAQVPVIAQPAASNTPDTLLPTLTDTLASTTSATSTDATTTAQIEDLMNQLVALLRQLIALKTGLTI